MKKDKNKILQLDADGNQILEKLGKVSMRAVLLGGLGGNLAIGMEYKDESESRSLKYKPILRLFYFNHMLDIAPILCT